MSAIRRLNSLSRTLVAFVAAVGAVLVAVFVPATASALVEYPPGAFTISLSASTVLPGAPVTVTVDGCVISTSITVSVDGTAISATADCETMVSAFRRPAAPAAGSASVTINAPTTPGTYTVRAVENGGAGRSATATLTVAPAGTTTTVPGGTLPSTGSDTMRVVSSAAAVVLIGAGAVLVSRRRRTPSAS